MWLSGNIISCQISWGRFCTSLTRTVQCLHIIYCGSHRWWSIFNFENVKKFIMYRKGICSSVWWREWILWPIEIAVQRSAFFIHFENCLIYAWTTTAGGIAQGPRWLLIRPGLSANLSGVTQTWACLGLLATFTIVHLSKRQINGFVGTCSAVTPTSSLAVLFRWCQPLHWLWRIWY